MAYAKRILSCCSVNVIGVEYLKCEFWVFIVHPDESLKLKTN